jgi:hypothetical protein
MTLVQQIIAARQLSKARRAVSEKTDNAPKRGFTDETKDAVYLHIDTQPVSHLRLRGKTGLALDTVRKVCRALSREGLIRNVGGHGRGGGAGAYAWIRTGKIGGRS